MMADEKSTQSVPPAWFKQWADSLPKPSEHGLKKTGQDRLERYAVLAFAVRTLWEDKGKPTYGLWRQVADALMELS